MKKAIAIVGLMACALPAWAAEGPSYNYVQANWIFDSELDADVPGVGSGSTDGDGFDIAGSFNVNEFFYVLGEYSDLGYDGGLDLSQITAGVGAHSNTYTGGIDVFGNLTYENIDIDGVGDDDGFGVEIGARTLLTPNFDAYISYKYEDISDVEGNFFKIGGAWGFTQNWAAIAQYRTGDYEDNSGDLDRDDIRVGVRYNF